MVRENIHIPSPPKENSGNSEGEGLKSEEFLHRVRKFTKKNRKRGFVEKNDCY